MVVSAFAPVTEMKFSYSTGRIYDGPQLLEITVVRTADWDEFDVASCEIYFNDKSRHIAGRHASISYKGDADTQATGGYVLRIYDAGKYLMWDPCTFPA